MRGSGKALQKKRSRGLRSLTQRPGLYCVCSGEPQIVLEQERVQISRMPGLGARPSEGHLPFIQQTAQHHQAGSPLPATDRPDTEAQQGEGLWAMDYVSLEWGGSEKELRVWVQVSALPLPAECSIHVTSPGRASASTSTPMGVASPVSASTWRPPTPAECAPSPRLGPELGTGLVPWMTEPWLIHTAVAICGDGKITWSVSEGPARQPHQAS